MINRWNFKGKGVPKGRLSKVSTSFDLAQSRPNRRLSHIKSVTYPVDQVLALTLEVVL